MIVVTGGAGFIGSNIVKALNERGHTDIAICDWLENGDKWRNIAKAAFVDIVAPGNLDAWLAARDDVEAIIHMGAISDTTENRGDEIVEQNIRFSLRLLDYCTARAIPFLYASSGAVYGTGELGFDDDASPTAIQGLRPLNLYGWSKRQFDYVVASRMANDTALPPVCAGFRFFNVFGPNEYHKGHMQSIVAKIAGPISRGERISLFKSYRDGVADGDQSRDFVYVSDAVDAVLSFLDGPPCRGIYNIGTGESRTFRELALAVFAAFDLPPAIDYIEMPIAIRDKYQYFTQASLARLRATGYVGDFLSIEEAVRLYVTTYLATDDPYR